MRTVTVCPTSLKRARELAGLTQQALATKVGVDRSSLAHWESAKRPDQPSGPHFKTLCRVLKVKPEQLLVVPDDRAA